MGAWDNKPCAMCGGRKGPAYATRKHCGRCALVVRKAARETKHRTKVGRQYGLSPGDYERLYDAQGGRCALCRWATGATRRLSVDHDHLTGEVRGLLCRPCNDLLGRIRDEMAYFLRGIEYLSVPPARSVLRQGDSGNGFQMAVEARTGVGA